MQKRGQCSNVASRAEPSRAVSLICGCDLISANWLIGTPDTDDATIHDAYIRARGKGRKNGRGKKKGTTCTYTRATSFHGSFSGKLVPVLVLDPRPVEPDFFFTSLFISFFIPSSVPLLSLSSLPRFYHSSVSSRILSLHDRLFNFPRRSVLSRLVTSSFRHILALFLFPSFLLSVDVITCSWPCLQLRYRDLVSHVKRCQILSLSLSLFLYSIHTSSSELLNPAKSHGLTTREPCWVENELEQLARLVDEIVLKG